MFIPERITQCRKQLEMSQEKFLVFLAQGGLQISRPTLASWERGITTPTANELALLATTVDQPVGYFFTLKHNPTGYDDDNCHPKRVR